MKMLMMISVLAGATLTAQQNAAPPPVPGQNVMFPNNGGLATGLVTGKTVKASPYSAEAVTEGTQTLADGNHIVQRTSFMQYRDSRGRERREVYVSALRGTVILISDPVANERWTLYPGSHTAQIMPLTNAAPPPFSPPPIVSLGTLIQPATGFDHGALVGRTTRGSVAGQAGIQKGDVILALNGQSIKDDNDLRSRMASIPAGTKITLSVNRQGQEMSFSVTTRDRPETAKDSAGVMARMDESSRRQVDLMTFQLRQRLALIMNGLTADQINESRTDDLGTQTVEGISAQGTRITVTVPAGLIGNERAFDVVNETWYSSELHTVLMEKHSDPRSGDVLYRLTGISRGEPDASFFQVPKDFKIVQQPVPALVPRTQE